MPVRIICTHPRGYLRIGLIAIDEQAAIFVVAALTAGSGMVVARHMHEEVSA